MVTSFADVPAAASDCMPGLGGLSDGVGGSVGPAAAMSRSPSFTMLSVRMLVSCAADEPLGLKSPLEPRRCLQQHQDADDPNSYQVSCFVHFCVCIIADPSHDCQAQTNRCIETRLPNV